MENPERIDKLLVYKKLVKSRSLAQALIREGAVECKVAGVWQPIAKPSLVVPVETELRVRDSENLRFVSRAGLKLDFALDTLQLNLHDKKVLDVGQSTGGFSDCVLQRGCAQVVGIDVGHDQLDPKIRNNAKVTCLEGVNARELHSEQVGNDFDLVVMDVSFISQTKILPQLGALMKPQAMLVSLVKPQFEVGPSGLGKGGLVKNVDLLQEVENKICTVLNHLGFSIIKYFDSPIAGGDGNKEFFVAAKKDL